jgi:hypothetical protein
MTKEERDRLKKSIQYSKDALSKGLILDSEARSQIYRMIAYEEAKLKKEEENKQDPETESM